MKTPSLKKVQEHFKNAKEVKCLADFRTYNISNFVLSKEIDGDEIFFVFKESEEMVLCGENSRKYCIVWNYNEYAEIISYKEGFLSKENFDSLQETPTESKEGLRYNKGKDRWSLVDFEALKPMVKVLEMGAEKYDDHNWKKGLKTTEVCESLLRHLTAYLNGEDNDQESGLPHTGHILCNAMFLSHMHEFKKEFDTRYKKQSNG